MSKDITFKWLGHSCFKISCENYSMVLDPFKDGTVPGYSDVRETACDVFCSHEHGDHSFREAVTLIDGPVSPFKVSELICPHDDQGGELRGMNTIRVFDNGELRIAHMGDIGCPLSPEQLEAIGQLDLIMIPVGGYYTMAPEGIEALLDEIKPRVVIPMHYRTESFGYPVIGTLDDYLKLTSRKVIAYDSSSFVLSKDTPAQIAVLKYQG